MDEQPDEQSAFAQHLAEQSYLVKGIVIALYSLCSIFIIIRDIFLIWTILRSKKLVFSWHLYLTSFVFADFLIGALMIPNSIFSYFQYDFANCAFNEFVSTASCVVSALSLIELCVDCFKRHIRPRSTEPKLNKVRGIIGAGWGLALIFACTTLLRSSCTFPMLLFSPTFEKMRRIGKIFPKIIFVLFYLVPFVMGAGLCAFTMYLELKQEKHDKSRVGMLPASSQQADERACCCDENEARKADDSGNKMSGTEDNKAIAKNDDNTKTVKAQSEKNQVKECVIMTLVLAILFGVCKGPITILAFPLFSLDNYENLSLVKQIFESFLFLNSVLNVICIFSMGSSIREEFYDKIQSYRKRKSPKNTTDGKTSVEEPNEESIFC